MKHTRKKRRATKTQRSRCVAESKGCSTAWIFPEWIYSDMKAAHSRFLPDILPAKTIVVRHRRMGKPFLLRTCLNARANPQHFTFHRTEVPSNCCAVKYSRKRPETVTTSNDRRSHCSVVRFIFAASRTQQFRHAWPGILNFLEIKIQPQASTDPGVKA